MAFQENKLSVTARCETEDGSAGEQPSRDGSVTITSKTVPAGNAAGVLKATMCRVVHA